MNLSNRTPQLVIGTAQLTSKYGILQQSVELDGHSPADFILSAEKLGFDAIDTAPAYSGAESAIGTINTPLEIHTKLDPSMSPLESIRGSLLRLRRDRVSIAYLHDPDAALTGRGRAIREARMLVGRQIDCLGVSTYSVSSMTAALEHETVGAVQIPVNPLKRDLLEASSQFSGRAVRFYARSLVGQGLLVNPHETLPERVAHLRAWIREFHELCSALERSPLEVCLKWAQDRENIHGLVMGAASPTQLKELKTALLSPPLSAEENSAIDSLRLPPPHLFDPRSW
jgi:aryl-alcohol dehydrogenase-like predicted oxidoreductase